MAVAKLAATTLIGVNTIVVEVANAKSYYQKNKSS
jgi:hypothetical protein